MTDKALVLIGGPDSGKTNYLARFWKALSSRDCCLFAPDVPLDIRYVEEALAHLLQGSFAPRSDKNFDDTQQSFVVPIVSSTAPDAKPIQVVVPDVTGELWQSAVETCELPEPWMSKLHTASGALVFVRIGSNQNVEPLDWVTSSQLLRMVSGAPDRGPQEKTEISTQVLLCELLRFLEHSLGADLNGIRPRVVVLVTAWDRLDLETKEKGPSTFIADQYPLFAGRLKDISNFDTKVFGVSVVGGDFTDTKFQEEFFESDLKDAGFVVFEKEGGLDTRSDVTLPVAWAIGAASFD